MAVVNSAAALGEAVGKLIEKYITTSVASVAKPRGCSAGPRRLVNGSGNAYQIDCVVCAQDGSPTIIVDPKYIRYTKHNRDKGSWLCVAHYNLRKAHPSIRKSITVLSGRWSAPSIQLIKSFGIEVHVIPFGSVVDALASRGVTFDWAEKDRITPAGAWASFSQLSEADKESLSHEIAGAVSLQVTKSVEDTLDIDLTTVDKRVTGVEVLLKTTHDEMFLYSYPSIIGAAQALLRLLSDRPDVSDMLK